MDEFHLILSQQTMSREENHHLYLNYRVKRNCLLLFHFHKKRSWANLLLRYSQTFFIFRNFSGKISSIPIRKTMRNSKEFSRMNMSLSHRFMQSVLAKTGQLGAFLIRPQSKQSSSSDHDYVNIVQSIQSNRLFISS